MQSVKFSKSVILVWFLAGTISVAAQTNRSAGNKKNAGKSAAPPTKTAETEPVEVKKNARPETASPKTAPTGESVSRNARPANDNQRKSIGLFLRI